MSVRKAKVCARHVDLGEAAAGAEEPVDAAPRVGFDKRTDDLPRVVDAASECSECARHVDLGEAAAGVEEPVGGTRAVEKRTDDLPRVVDAESGRTGRIRHVDLGEAAA